MPHSNLSDRAPSTPFNSLDDVRLTPVKANLSRQTRSMTVAAVLREAFLRHYGSLKCAALTLGIDQGQLTRELQTGDFKLKRLDTDPEATAFVASALYEAFASSDPKARAQRLIREGRRVLDELAEVL